ncbi:MAG: hypothetical protein CM1200mP12_22550 [Gammaproteobacteria bacterium]|nr:MAG: hypothetical protein CM1200mP12_22550 [Gammaproteobacteria bacterium]
MQIAVNLIIKLIIQLKFGLIHEWMDSGGEIEKRDEKI